MAVQKCNRVVVLDLPYSAWRDRMIHEIMVRQELDSGDEETLIFPFTFASIPLGLIGGEDTVVLRSHSHFKH